MDGPSVRAAPKEITGQCRRPCRIAVHPVLLHKQGVLAVAGGNGCPETLLMGGEQRSAGHVNGPGEVDGLVVADPGRGEEGDQEAEGNADEEEQALWAHPGSVPMSPAAPGAAFPPK